jgi:hypothetical protein
MDIRQRWRQTALHNKLGIVIGALAVTVAAAGVIANLSVQKVYRTEDRRP